MIPRMLELFAKSLVLSHPSPTGNAPHVSASRFTREASRYISCTSDTTFRLAWLDKNGGCANKVFPGLGQCGRHGGDCACEDLEDAPKDVSAGSDGALGRQM
jgi:hypothetical protein